MRSRGRTPAPRRVTRAERFPSALHDWATEVRERRGSCEAAVALARKLATMNTHTYLLPSMREDAAEKLASFILG